MCTDNKIAPAVYVALARERYRPSARRAKTRYTNRKRRLVAELKSGPCLDCGLRFHHAAMDFDHVRGVKINDVATLVSNGRSGILEEIAKCELVCANCHRVRTYRRLHG